MEKAKSIWNDRWEMGTYVWRSLCRKKWHKKVISLFILFFLLFHMVGKPYVPGGFPFQLIDSRTCSGCEHKTSAGGEHPLLSVHLSRGAFTVCSRREIDVHTFYFSLTVSTAFTHSLFYINGPCALPSLWSCNAFGTQPPLLLSQALYVSP